MFQGNSPHRQLGCRQKGRQGQNGDLLRGCSGRSRRGRFRNSVRFGGTGGLPPKNSFRHRAGRHANPRGVGPRVSQGSHHAQNRSQGKTSLSPVVLLKIFK